MSRTILIALLGSLALGGAGRGQVNPNVWVTPSCCGPQPILEVSPEGVRIGSHPGPTGLASSITRDGLGRVFATDQQGPAIRVYQNGGLVAVIPNPPVIIDIACDGLGNLWVLTGNGFTSSTLRKYDSTLTEVLAVNVGPFAKLGAAPGGAVWVWGGGQLQRILSDGTVVVSVPHPGSVHLAPDSQGRVWVSRAVSNVIDLWSITGAMIAQVALPGIISDVAVDRCDTVWAVQNSVAGNPSTLYRVNAAGQILATVTLPAIYHSYSNAHPDTAGNIWVQIQQPTGGLLKVGSDGNPITVVATPSGTWPAMRGDVTGFKFAAISDRNGDHDGDGIATGIEFGLGSDPLNGASLPPVLAAGIVPVLFPPVIQVSYSDPSRPGAPYVLAASLGRAPGIPLDPGGCPSIPLEPDLLFWMSVHAPAGVFSGFMGTLDAAGHATASIHVPSGFPPQTITVFIGGITLGPGIGTTGIAGIADGIPVLIP